MSEIKRSSERSVRTRPTPDELSEHLDEVLGISNFEEGLKLVGAVIAQKLPNNGAIKSILKAAWKEYGEAKIVWVRENLFSITRWPPNLAIEEVEVNIISHWIHIRGIRLNLCHEENVIKLGRKAGKAIDFEDPGKQRGFLRIRIGVDTNLPLLASF
ncbi:unnamed protein product [Prunus armeniaca]|uniref:Uncharacterized protein n=1 Tax=Prunus armeniaca TaxID=36596 RepID=A0A6J5U7F4_PRUAR|nr:unnamed protein product [Prunus armeniaca]